MGTLDRKQVKGGLMNKSLKDLYIVREDFQHSTTGGIILFTAAQTGTGAGATLGNYEELPNYTPDAVNRSRMGIVTFSTGTTATGRAGTLSNVNCYTFNTNQYQLAVSARLGNHAISDGTDTYQAYIGFLDSITAVSTDGAYFLHDSTSANWQCVSRSNNVQTLVNSGVPVQTNRYALFEIRYDPIANALTYYINNVLVATITTNIPNTTARLIGLGYFINKTVGLIARTITIDYTELEIVLANSRH